jgi:hypothetical protein
MCELRTPLHRIAQAYRATPVSIWIARSARMATSRHASRLMTIQLGDTGLM